MNVSHFTDKNTGEEKIYVTGCRIHESSNHCSGFTIPRVSALGAEMEMCEGAFNRQPRGMWKTK